VYVLSGFSPFPSGSFLDVASGSLEFAFYYFAAFSEASVFGGAADYCYSCFYSPFAYA